MYYSTKIVLWQQIFPAKKTNRVGERFIRKLGGFTPHIVKYGKLLFFVAIYATANAVDFFDVML